MTLSIEVWVTKRRIFLAGLPEAGCTGMKSVTAPHAQLLSCSPFLCDQRITIEGLFLLQLCVSISSDSVPSQNRISAAYSMLACVHACFVKFSTKHKARTECQVCAECSPFEFHRRLSPMRLGLWTIKFTKAHLELISKYILIHADLFSS